MRPLGDGRPSADGRERVCGALSGMQQAAVSCQAKRLCETRKAEGRGNSLGPAFFALLDGTQGEIRNETRIYEMKDKW